MEGQGLPKCAKKIGALKDALCKYISDSVVWRITGKDLLIIAVYAPHDNKDKQMLWDYLTYEIGKWKGEVVIMGDFNEVRYKSDRFGSVFNVRGANVFNSFISSAGLEEVPLGGSTFTWCHKSATKMNFFIIGLIEGFSKVVEDEWRGKAQSKHKEELEALEEIIDKGNGNEVVVNKRMEVSTVGPVGPERGLRGLNEAISGPLGVLVPLKTPLTS
ncbi:RNA-directed DNA polymerase, eukaryota [Tanacetum coccineum]